MYSDEIMLHLLVISDEGSEARSRSCLRKEGFTYVVWSRKVQVRCRSMFSEWQILCK